VLVDTHCHLNINFAEDSLEAVLDRAKKNNVHRIVVPGTDLVTSVKAVEMAKKYTEVYAAVGIHPNDAQTWTSDSIYQLKALAQQPKVVAIGEIGLDYYHELSTHDLQQQIFREQLELASELALPVLVHNRQSTTDTLAMIKSWRGKKSFLGYPGVFHAFEGDFQLAEEIISMGFLLGIGGMVTFKNKPGLQQVVTALGMNHLVLETDAPYLSPHPLRGRQNEPANILIIAEKISALHACELGEVETRTFENANRLFRWETLN
jgi:TatD DNase family protein